VSGHFIVNGVAQAAAQFLVLSAAELTSATFTAGAGASDSLWVTAFDGGMGSGAELWVDLLV
jgi:hypothetical protein